MLAERRLRRLTTFVVLALAALWATAVAAGTDGPLLLRLDSARLDYTTPQAPAASAAQDVRLPRFLPAATPGQHGRLRFAFDLPRPSELLLHVEASREHFIARLNGVPVYDSRRGTDDAPRLRSWRMSPSFSLPAALLREGRNEIELTLLAQPGRVLLIAPLWVGEPAAVERLGFEFLVRDVIAPLMIASVIATFGLIALALALARGSRERSLFLLYAAGALLFAAVILSALLPEPPLPGVHYAAWWYASYMWFACALDLVALRFAGVRWPAYERTLQVLAMLALPLMYAVSLASSGVISSVALNAYGVWLMLALSLSVLAMYALVRAALKERNRQAWPMFAFVAISWGLGLFDIVDGFVLQQIVTSFRLTPYAGLVYAVWAGWVLASRFRRTTADLERLNRDLDARVRSASARLREQLDEVRAAHREAEQASEAKSTFLAAVSHDLRQPLHSLGMFVSALEQHVSNDEGRQMQQRVRSAFSALEGLFNELLDLSRLDAGTVEAHPRPTELQPLFDRMGDLFHAEADRRGLSLRFVPTRHTVDTDPVLLERILANLVSNALRYTERGGVLVGARRRGDDIVVEVRDSGIGIGAEQQDKVFDDFYQVDNPARDRSRGLGLGLAIVRRLALLLGHPIELRSRPGGGTVFSARVPRAAATGIAVEADQPQVEPQGLRGKCVLVVDDEAEVREASLALLALWGVRGLGAAGPSEAQALLANGARPDAVIADLRLGAQADGIELVQRLRRQRGSEIPALLVSGDTGARELMRVKSSGLPLLIKPVAPARLKAALHACLHAVPGSPPGLVSPLAAPDTPPPIEAKA